MLAGTAILACTEERTNGSIAFISLSFDPPSADLYLTMPDGSGLRQLTNGLLVASVPVWSPDGKYIAFSTRDIDERDLYVLDVDRGDLRRLTDGLWVDFPSWSPDGRLIAFGSYEGGYVKNQADLESAVGVLRIVDVTTGENRVLLGDLGKSVLPRWSPDGKSIAFTQQDSVRGDWDAYVVRSDGTALQKLMDNPENDGLPNWSPDSTVMVFESFRNNSPSIYVVNADGSGLRPLVDAVGSGPAWSPDGKSVSFTSFHRTGAEIAIVDSDGTNLRELTNGTKGVDAQAAWSPDGRTIAFTSEGDGNVDLFVMDTRGKGVKRLTDDSLREVSPTWRP